MRQKWEHKPAFNINFVTVEFILLPGRHGAWEEKLQTGQHVWHMGEYTHTDAQVFGSTYKALSFMTYLGRGRHHTPSTLLFEVQIQLKCLVPVSIWCSERDDNCATEALSVVQLLWHEASILPLRIWPSVLPFPLNSGSWLGSKILGSRYKTIF